MKKDGLPELAEKIFNDLKYDFNIISEKKTASVNVTEDKMLSELRFVLQLIHDSLADGTVTLRERDTMKQERVKIEDLRRIIDEK